MKRASWDGRLRTGNAVIDADHRDLIRLFNQVVSAATHRAGKQTCNAVLDKLIKHASAHFEWEERLMEEYDYPEKAVHAAQHEALIRQARNYRFDPGSAHSTIPLIELSPHWLTFHTRTADKKLTEFLANVLPPRTHMMRKPVRIVRARPAKKASL